MKSYGVVLIFTHVSCDFIKKSSYLLNAKFLSSMKFHCCFEGITTYGVIFLGKSGQEMVMNCNGQRTAQYALLNVNSSGEYEIVGIYSTSNKSVNNWSVRWPFGVPSDTPTCGFDLSKCPSRFPRINKFLITLKNILNRFIGPYMFFIYIFFSLRQG